MSTFRLTRWVLDWVRESKKDHAPIRLMQKTHDYTQRFWGHDFAIHEVIDKGRKLRTSGFGRGIREGDYLILPNEGHTTRYQVENIEYMLDPDDMWFAGLVFAPRETV